MKKYFILVSFLISGWACSQIGINTSNPQGIFTIDSSKDNPETGVPQLSQQANDITVLANGNTGIGISNPTTKLHIKSDTPGGIRIADGTQGAGKILVSDALGVATWQNSAPPVVINSTTGSSIALATGHTWVGSSATVTIPGYYLVSPRLITDKSPANCGSFIAYNLSTSPTSWVNPSFSVQDSHFSTGTLFDFIYSANVGYLQAGTYYMLVRYSGGCNSNITRANAGENSFTLILLR
ncbi:hypothetical protein [Chryseobacterium sp. MMS23-Vi53]|uniref:hypothetical protein n=1 Tax=Chryseobacterium sp. MMS23-Vi53 TaxID=3386644 RepID=UPI0039E77CEC